MSEERYKNWRYNALALAFPLYLRFSELQASVLKDSKALQSYRLVYWKTVKPVKESEIRWIQQAQGKHPPPRVHHLRQGSEGKRCAHEGRHRSDLTEFMVMLVTAGRLEHVEWPSAHRRRRRGHDPVVLKHHVEPLIVAVNCSHLHERKHVRFSMVVSHARKNAGVFRKQQIALTISV